MTESFQALKAHFKWGGAALSGVAVSSLSVRSADTGAISCVFMWDCSLVEMDSMGWMSVSRSVLCLVCVGGGVNFEYNLTCVSRYHFLAFTNFMHVFS
jgi:hypothetical protein